MATTDPGTDPGTDAGTGRHRRGTRGIRVVAVTAAVAALAFSCSTEEQVDLVADAEYGIRAQIQSELGLESEVTCDEPATLEVGVNFHCHAEAEDGTEYDFTAEILEGDVIGTKLD